tara:strand:+ start:2268 stop:2936 length:669 start_codon:yes stop_codon:yes gene_type:complete
MATESGIKEAIRHIANNWRRKDSLFYSQSYPVYEQAFKDIDDETLEAAIIKFVTSYTNSFSPPFGIIKDFVMKEIGIKENKERTSALDCPDCERGMRQTSVLWRGKEGQYKMRQSLVCCTCAAGKQRRRNIGPNHNKEHMIFFDDWLDNLRDPRWSDRILCHWVTSREMRKLPPSAYDCSNPKMMKQRQEAAASQGRKMFRPKEDPLSVAISSQMKHIHPPF